MSIIDDQIKERDDREPFEYWGRVMDSTIESYEDEVAVVKQYVKEAKALMRTFKNADTESKKTESVKEIRKWLDIFRH